jgi:stalled ribosome rescue protein Dom34
MLIGLEEDHATLWQIFSNVVKPHTTVKLEGRRKDEQALYNFHEAIINATRPTLKEGTRSIMTTAPMRTAYTAEFLTHVKRHHPWLTQLGSPNAVAFGELVGPASKLHEVAELAKTKEFRRLISETTSKEADNIVDTLEKRLNTINDNAMVLFSVKEIEDLVYSQWKDGKVKPEYLMLTDKYLTERKDKNRIHRLLQIARNRLVKTKIVNAETPAGKRLSQFGGLVCFTETKQTESS